MSRLNVFPGVDEDGGVSLMALVTGWTGTPITVATVSAIALKVIEYANEQEAVADINGTAITIANGSPTTSSIISDTLSTVNWTADSTGYNFRYDAQPECFPSGNKWYRLEFKLTPTSGAPVWVKFVGPSDPTNTS